MRYLKILLALFIALLCLLYGGQNLMNLESGYQYVASVVGMQDNVLYPHSLAFSIDSPWLIWLILAVIIIIELAAGIVALKGTWDLWQNRTASAEQFNAAKTFALLGAGLGLIVWFGLFTVIGGAYYQMWQTELGAGSLAGAFQFLGSIGIIALFINMMDR